MKVLLAIGCSGDQAAFTEAMLGELGAFVDRGGAARAALDVRATGDDLAALKALDTEPDAIAMVSLWDTASAADAVGLTLPPDGELVGAYRVEEVVQRDYDRTWDKGEESPGIKVVCFVHRKPGMSHEAYSDHWRLNHGPLALELQPGFWHYVQNHIVEYLTDDSKDFDGIGELHFRTTDAVLTEMFVSEDAVTLIMDDTERFMDNATSTTIPAKEHLVP